MVLKLLFHHCHNTEELLNEAATKPALPVLVGILVPLDLWTSARRSTDCSLANACSAWPLFLVLILVGGKKSGGRHLCPSLSSLNSFIGIKLPMEERGSCLHFPLVSNFYFALSLSGCDRSERRDLDLDCSEVWGRFPNPGLLEHLYTCAAFLCAKEEDEGASLLPTPDRRCPLYKPFCFAWAEREKKQNPGFKIGLAD